MTLPKGILVAEIEDGQAVEGLFLLHELSRAQTKNGKPYLIVTVADRSGSMAGRVWEDADRWAQGLKAGEVVALAGVAQAYRGEIQLRIASLRPVSRDQVDMAFFLPATAADVEALGAELAAHISSITDPPLRLLLSRLFDSGPFLTAFMAAPAAKRLHHACLGGLLEHTCAVARLADRVAQLYPAVDRSLLMAGALVHDIGKTHELDPSSFPFEYTDQGRLVGHVVLGAQMVQAAASAIEGFPPEVATRLVHLVLSHHGQPEFGAPAVPMLLEAFILNLLDDLDAKVNQFRRLAEGLREPGYQWSDYQRHLERYLLVLGPAQQEEGSPEPPPAGEPGSLPGGRRQPSLW
ncbi:MAG: HD domain-containing protein [Thermodesulfobacteriota bacterium]